MLDIKQWLNMIPGHYSLSLYGKDWCEHFDKCLILNENPNKSEQTIAELSFLGELSLKSIPKVLNTSMISF